MVAVAALLAGLGAFAPPAHAGEPVVTDVRLEPFVSNVGDRIALTIIVDHDAGVVVEGPSANSDFGTLEFLNAETPLVVPNDMGGERTTLRYTVTTFTLGSAATPGFEIRWRGAGEEGVLNTAPAPYTVDSVLSADDNALRPLKAQFDLPQPAPPAFVPVAFAAAMAALTALGYWLMRLAIGQRPAPVFVPAMALVQTAPPDVTARAALDDIAASGLAERDREAYYARLAETIRRYLSARFDFPAYALTRREMELGMTGAGIDRWPARVTTNLLEQCDAVQFAKFRPARERLEQDLAAAYEIVAITSDSSETVAAP